MSKSTNSNFTFPRTDIPKKDKENEEYHKSFALAIVNETINANFDVSYTAMDESVTFFNGDQGGDEFNFLQSAADGEVLPAKWITFNRIRSKMEILFGELQAKGYQINCTTINKDAKARKLQAKERARVNMRMTPDREMMEQEYGLSLTPDGYVPKDEEDLETFFNYTFQEQNEIIMEYALRFLAKKHRWSYTRLAAYRDLMIMGKAFYWVEMKDGLPYIRRVDPRFMVYDPNATDDFLSDSSYFGELRYMTLADAASKYNLSEQEIKDVYGKYEQYQKNPYYSTHDRSMYFGLNGSTIKYFKGEGNDLRVLVISAIWQDQEVIKHRVSEDKYGGEHIKQVADTAEKGKLEANTIAQWRKATLIGGELIKDWGIMENSVRQNDSMAETSAPVKALIPNYYNGKAISKVDQVKGLQKVKDLALYNLQLEMSTAGRKGFIYDVSQTPDGWDIHTVMKYLKTAGIAFIDSKKDGMPATHNQFQKVDQTLGDSVNHYITIATLMDAQMDTITGINDARQGDIQGSSQAVGVTQSALLQSNMATKMYEDLFNQLNDAALNYQAGLVKVSFAGNDKYAPIIGDVGINFLEENVDLELDDFAAYIEEVPPLLNDLNSFREIVNAALHSGQLDFPTAAKLLIEKDITVGINKLEAVTAENMKRAQEAEEKRFQLESQRNELEAKRLQQNAIQLENVKGDYRLEEQRIENKGEIDKVIVKGRIDQQAGKVDAAGKITLEKLKSNAQARKDTVIKP